MLKAGVLGAGHLGKIHLRLLQESNRYDLVGFYDSNKDYGKEIAAQFGYRQFDTIEELLENVDMVDVVTPTTFHFENAKQIIKAGKHLFVEKPITSTVEEAQELLQLAKDYNVKGQVGHVERFNPAFKSVKDEISNTMFIEAHRLAEFNPRGTDVSVIMDLMIHDIDIVLSTVKSKVKKINASGVSIISNSPDIANARIEFENKCVANLTASRISLKKMRKTRIFQKDAYISIDFLEKELQIVKIKDAVKSNSNLSMVIKTNTGKDKIIYFENPVF